MKTFFSRKGNVFIWHISFGYESNKIGPSTWYKVFCDTYVLFMLHPKGRAAPFQITNQITSHFLFNYTFFSNIVNEWRSIKHGVHIHTMRFCILRRKKPRFNLLVWWNNQIRILFCLRHENRFIVSCQNKKRLETLATFMCASFNVYK